MSKAFVKEDEAEEVPEPVQIEKSSQPRYITPEGFKRLKNELDRLWRVDRRKVTAEVSAAAAMGDRSENAEYIYGKKKLREIDRRLEYLTKRLDTLTIVKSGTGKRDRVFFGAWVTVEDEDGDEATYRIVGPDEYDASAGRISVDSPLAKALLGKRKNDEVTVKRPKGDAEVTIIRIRYEDDDAS
jgi:transcription elongation factor GreB